MQVWNNALLEQNSLLLEVASKLVDTRILFNDKEQYCIYTTLNFYSKNLRYVKVMSNKNIEDQLFNMVVPNNVEDAHKCVGIDDIIDVNNKYNLTITSGNIISYIKFYLDAISIEGARLKLLENIDEYKINNKYNDRSKLNNIFKEPTARQENDCYIATFFANYNSDLYIITAKTSLDGNVDILTEKTVSLA